jgi:hypothetical protein
LEITGTEIFVDLVALFKDLDTLWDVDPHEELVTTFTQRRWMHNVDLFQENQLKWVGGSVAPQTPK